MLENKKAGWGVHPAFSFFSLFLSNFELLHQLLQVLGHLGKLLY
jgi:hypothetical protein